MGVEICCRNMREDTNLCMVFNSVTWICWHVWIITSRVYGIYIRGRLVWQVDTSVLETLNAAKMVHNCQTRQFYEYLPSPKGSSQSSGKSSPLSVRCLSGRNTSGSPQCFLSWWTDHRLMRTVVSCITNRHSALQDADKLTNMTKGYWQAGTQLYRMQTH